MSKQLTIFSLLQSKPKRRCIVLEENPDEKLKNDVHNCFARLVDNVAKKVEREEKDETAKKKPRKSKTDYHISREKIEAWLKDDAFKFWDTTDGKPVKDKTKGITWLEISFCLQLKK